ncbi:MAG: rod-binding protein [Alphaproteobacteria bacterium]|nr:rod-binding protein [Alphaproteobacteria bacterium]MBV9693114.1 rod-binding protein [Alphaproteobacteria bacterium]
MSAQAGLVSLAAAAVKPPHAGVDVAATRKVAQQFEGVLVSQMLNDMFQGVGTDSMFGGGPGEEMFRSLMVDEYGKRIAAQGGLGLADHVTRELLKRQEGLS